MPFPKISLQVPHDASQMLVELVSEGPGEV